MPPTIPIYHCLSSKNQQYKNSNLLLLFHANVYKTHACLKHSDFLKVKSIWCHTTQSSAVVLPKKMPRRDQMLTQRADQSPTTEIKLRAF